MRKLIVGHSSTGHTSTGHRLIACEPIERKRGERPLLIASTVPFILYTVEHSVITFGRVKA